MKEKWLEIQQKINALQARERLLLLAIAVVLPLMLWQLLLIDPLLAERALVAQQTRQAEQAIIQLQADQQLISTELSVGVNRAEQRRREQLLAELAGMEQRIENSVVGMIPPQLMAEVLEKILVQDSGLKLLSLENKPVVPVLEQKTADAKQTGSRQALYNHGFTLRLQGDYQSTLRYFEALAQLPWRFYWDGLRYQVEDYPQAIIILEVHTVSMSEEWIGV